MLSETSSLECPVSYVVLDFNSPWALDHDEELLSCPTLRDIPQRLESPWMIEVEARFPDGRIIRVPRGIYSMRARTRRFQLIPECVWLPLEAIPEHYEA